MTSPLLKINRHPFRPGRRRSPARRAALAVAGTALLVAAPLGLATPAPASAAPETASLAGVSLNFGDQVGEYKTIVDATDALKGAAYTVNWSNFIGGPPIIAAEIGGSVDLGDMAETPVIFAQAAGDPVKVVAVTEGTTTTQSAYGIVVPPDSPIKTASQLRGKTIAVQEGTVEQYVLVQVLKAAGIPYGDVTIDNLTVTAGEAALTSGKVDAWVGTQPFIALVQQNDTGKLLPTAAKTVRVLGYLTAPESTLDNPKKSAAIVDFVARLYKSQAILRKDPQLAAETYVKTYGVPLAVAEKAVKSAQQVPTTATPSLIAYQQNEANAFLKLGLIPNHLDASQVFDTSMIKRILAAYAALQK